MVSQTITVCGNLRLDLKYCEFCASPHSLQILELGSGIILDNHYDRREDNQLLGTKMVGKTIKFQ